MTRDHSFDGDITTANEFHTALTDLLLNAHRNKVAIAGAWECRNGASAPDWETQIVELTKPEN